jgi:signal transduction histidine kinase
MAKEEAASTAPSKSSGLVRGEWRLAAIAAAVAALFIVSLAAATWWAVRVQTSTAETGRTEQLRALGGTLAATTEVMMADGELSAVRRIVSAAARENGLSRCRIVLPGGQVIADATPSQITVHELPAKWPDGQVATEPRIDGLEQVFPMMIVEHGPAQLELTAHAVPPAAGNWTLQAGVAAVSVVALLVLIMLHRYVRTSTRGIWAVRQALLEREGGQKTAEALEVNPQWGPEARAWNSLLSDDRRQNRQTTLGTVRERLQVRQGCNDHLAAACDALSQGLVLVTENMRADYVNGAAGVLLQAKREEMISAPVSTFIQDPRVLEAVQTAATGQLFRRTIVEVKRPSETGNGLLRFIVRPVRRGDGGVAMIIIEDITQQRVAEESRNAFVAQATHELRTPLTNIRLYTEMALDEGKDNPEIRANCLNVINQEAFRLDRMVGDILSIAEIEAGSFSLRKDDVRLEDIFKQLHDDYVAQAQEGKITLNMTLPPKLPVIKADRNKIVLALHNLLGNAMKYTPAGGQVNVTVLAEHGRLAVDVADTGIGISEEDCQRIFEKFYRARDPRIAQIKGSGLGLAIAREVIRLHGGDIVVQSIPDKGSTFTLSLPIPDEAA